MRPLTLRNVLVATDLSSAAVPVLRAAAELSRLAGARLHVVHASPDASNRYDRVMADHVTAAGIGSDVLAETCIYPGAPERVIAEEARRVEADVIVLGPHRLGGAYPVEGTAYRVASASAVPCLVLPRALQLPLGSVLVPIDDSPAARGALAVALTWGSALRRRARRDAPDATRFTIMHVTPDDPERATQVMQDSVEAVRDRFAAIAGLAVNQVVEQGDSAAATIVRRAAADEVDLVVLGTRGGMIAADGLGSVAAHVISAASRPVLVVPPSLWRAAGQEPLV